jgi:hypothetical protein
MDNQLKIEMVNCYRQSDWLEVESLVAAQDFQIIRFDGATVVDKASFLAQAGRDLPLDEGCQPQSWDGFVDCLWGGLYHVESPRVALVWQSAHVLLQSDLQLFLTVNRLLDGVAQSVATTENGFSHEMWLALFLVGEGELFEGQALA